MESPHMAWEFMKKLSKSPWAPVIRLIEDPDVLGCEPGLNLQEDLDDCALVVEEADSAALRKTSNPDSSGEDSDVVARYYPSPSDSDDSVVVRQDLDCSKFSTLKPSNTVRLPPSGSDSTTPADSRQRTAQKPCPKSNTARLPPSRSDSSTLAGSRQRTAQKPCPKSKKPVRSSGGSRPKTKPCPKVEQSFMSSSSSQAGAGNDSSGTAITHNRDETKFVYYNGQQLKLKTLKIVLIDLAFIHAKYRLGHSQKTLESSGDESGKTTDVCKNPIIEPKPVLISDSDESTVVGLGTDEGPSENVKNPSSSNVGNLKRPQENLSWGLDSIQELEKRRKLGKAVRNDVNDDQEIHLVTPCSTEAPKAWLGNAASSSKLKPRPSSSLPNYTNTFGLNAWRLGLVMQELKRLQELADKLQKNHLKLDLQKQVAYKFKYGLNEVARLVTKKSLNSIVAEREKLELKELREKECRVSTDAKDANKAVPESEPLSKDMSPFDKLTQVSQLDKGKNYLTSTSKDLKSTGTLNPQVVDVYMPTLVQGVAAGFLGIFDRLERLESQCDNIERRVSQPKETSRSIDIREVD